VTVINGDDYKVIKTLEAGIAPYGVAVTPDNQWLYVANQGTNDVWVFDTQRLQRVAKIDVGEMPESVSFTDDSQYAYVTNWFSNTLSVIDIKSQKVIKQIAMPDGPRSLGRFIGD
jgi:YVTN family beta-propeller protein